MKTKRNTSQTRGPRTGTSESGGDELVATAIKGVSSNASSSAFPSVALERVLESVLASSRLVSDVGLMRPIDRRTGESVSALETGEPGRETGISPRGSL